MKMRIFYLVKWQPGFFCLLLWLFCACSFKANNWQSNSSPGFTKARFAYFNTWDGLSVRATKDGTIFLSWRTFIDAGAITASISDGNKIIWQKHFTAKQDSNTIKLNASHAGEYRLRLKGQRASGQYEFHLEEYPPQIISVTTNANIELFGLMMQLDLGPDLVASNDSAYIDGKKSTWKKWYAASLKNYMDFRRFDSCSMMQQWRNYSGRNYYNDFFIHFLLEVDEVPHAAINKHTDPDLVLAFSDRKDTLDARTKATAFLDSLNAFYRQIRFDKYLAEHEKEYSLVRATVMKNVPGPEFLPELEHFYGKKFKGYVLVPSLNIPTSMGFGKTNKFSSIIYNCFGPFSFQHVNQSPPDLGFDYPERIRGLSVHEFGHSFVNPVIDQLPGSLLDSTAYLFEPIREKMSKKAYTSWVICLYEHFVHAGEVIMARKLNAPDDAEKNLREDVAAGFIYLPQIIEGLMRYDNNRVPGISYATAVRQIVQALHPAN